MNTTAYIAYDFEYWGENIVIMFLDSYKLWSSDLYDEIVEREIYTETYVETKNHENKDADIDLFFLFEIGKDPFILKDDLTFNKERALAVFKIQGGKFSFYLSENGFVLAEIIYNPVILKELILPENIEYKKLELKGRIIVFPFVLEKEDIPEEPKLGLNMTEDDIPFYVLDADTTKIANIEFKTKEGYEVNAFVFEK